MAGATAVLKQDLACSGARLLTPILVGGLRARINDRQEPSDNQKRFVHQHLSQFAHVLQTTQYMVSGVLDVHQDPKTKAAQAMVGDFLFYGMGGGFLKC